MAEAGERTGGLIAAWIGENTAPRASQIRDETDSYNVVQRRAYLAVIFVLFPLVIWTGLAMSPAFDCAFPWTVQAAGRTSIGTDNAFLRHLGAGVVPRGPCGDGRHGRILQSHAGMITRRMREARGARMNQISRRKTHHGGHSPRWQEPPAWRWPTASLAATDSFPPDDGGFYGPGETLTYAAQRASDKRTRWRASFRAA